MPTATIQLNGDSRQVNEGQMLSELVRELELEPQQIAVELNRKIVPRAEYPNTSLKNGDELEVVTFVGGG